MVLIIVDQLASSSMTQWGAHLTGGIAGLIRRGAYYPNGEHAQANTSTGPGHASVATGTWPNVHGIISNVWFDQADGAPTYCVDDPVNGVGPQNLMAPTLGDALKLSTFGKGKVVAIAGKDRAAVLTGGHRPDAAVFYDAVAGRYVGGNWYGAKATPGWVEAVNRAHNPRAVFGQVWDRLLPALDYAQIAGPDDSPWEGTIAGIGKLFPKTLGLGLEGPNAAWLRSYRGTPQALGALIELAKGAVDAEALGADGHVDLLVVGLSTMDYVGHWFGPHSQEAFDHLLRVDRAVGDLVEHVEGRLGKGSTIWALTSDHGITMTPEISAKHGFGGKRVPVEDLRGLANTALAKLKRKGYPPATVPVIDAPLVFVGHEDRGADRVVLRRAVAAALSKHPDIAEAWAVDDVAQMASAFVPYYRRILYPGRSPDVLIRNHPHDLIDPRGYTTGSGHGSPYGYDVRVPIVLAGPGVRRGVDPTPVSITRLAPSLAALAGFDAPAAALEPPLAAALP